MAGNRNCWRSTNLGILWLLDLTCDAHAVLGKKKNKQQTTLITEQQWSLHLALMLC